MKIAIAGGTGTVGHHVVNSVRAQGHQPISLSRSQGINVRTGTGLQKALAGVEAIIDVTNAASIEYTEATAFFTDVADTLQHIGRESGIRHIVTLSIVGIEKASFGYYRAKLDHEQAASTGEVPHTVMRATQLHEFPAQLIAMTRDQDDMAQVFEVRVRPVAARTVAEVLTEIASGEPSGRAADLAGPNEADLVTLAREYVKARGKHITIQADIKTMADLPTNGLLPGDNARIEGPTFQQWLTSEDATTLPI